MKVKSLNHQPGDDCESIDTNIGEGDMEIDFPTLEMWGKLARGAAFTNAYEYAKKLIESYRKQTKTKKSELDTRFLNIVWHDNLGITIKCNHSQKSQHFEWEEGSDLKEPGGSWYERNKERLKREREKEKKQLRRQNR